MINTRQQEKSRFCIFFFNRRKKTSNYFLYSELWRKHRRHSVWYLSDPPRASFEMVPVKMPGNGFFFSRFGWKKVKKIFFQKSKIKKTKQIEIFQQKWKKNKTYLFELSPNCENTIMISTNHANSSQKSDAFTNWHQRMNVSESCFSTPIQSRNDDPFSLVCHPVSKQGDSGKLKKLNKFKMKSQIKFDKISHTTLENQLTNWPSSIPMTEKLWNW